MPKKKTQPAPMATEKILMSVVLLIVGFVLGQYIDVKNFDLAQKPEVMEERVYIGDRFELPEPQLDGALSVEEALQARRSRRAYTEDAVELADVSQVLWAMQGETADWGGRTAPSAKGAYPLSVTVVVKNVEGLEPGVYHYQSEGHTLEMIMDTVPEGFDEAAVQSQNKSAPVVFVLSGDYSKMTEAFDGKENNQNVILEAGHVGQNAYLQVESLGLGTLVSGGFNHDLMQEVLTIPAQEDLFYVIPLGVPAEELMEL